MLMPAAYRPGEPANNTARRRRGLAIGLGRGAGVRLGCPSLERSLECPCPLSRPLARPPAGCWSPALRDSWAGPWPRPWRVRGTMCVRGARVAPAGGAGTWTGYGEVGPDTRWDDALAGIDVVVHLAGLAHLPDEMAAARPILSPASTPRGPRGSQLPPCAAGVRRLVLMSSALVHGQASPGRPFTEGDAPAPATPYARSKLDSETRLVAAARGSALEWVILRPPMVYGPGARGNFRRLVQLVRAGVPLPLGAATAPKSFIGIDNLADAVVRAVEHPRAANQVFLVADAETTSTVGLVRLIAAGLGPARVDAVCAGCAAADRARARSGARAMSSACSIRSSWTPAASARCSTGRRRCRWRRACAARRERVARLTRRPDRWARDSRWPAGWSRSPCRRRPSARRTWPPSCRPCARPRRGWRCSSRSRW